MVARPGAAIFTELKAQPHKLVNTKLVVTDKKKLGKKKRGKMSKAKLPESEAINTHHRTELVAPASTAGNTDKTIVTQITGVHLQEKLQRIKHCESTYFDQH